MDCRRYGKALRFAAGEHQTPSNAELMLKHLASWDLAGRAPDTDHTARAVAADALQEEGREVEAHILRTKTPVAVDDGKVVPDFPRQENGYPFLYYPRDSGVHLCHECANHHVVRWAESKAAGGEGGLRGSRSVHPDLIQQDVHWEGPPEVCDGCQKEIESAYGDPDAEENPGG